MKSAQKFMARQHAFGAITITQSSTLVKVWIQWDPGSCSSNHLGELAHSTRLAIDLPNSRCSFVHWSSDYKNIVRIGNLKCRIHLDNPRWSSRGRLPDCLCACSGLPLNLRPKDFSPLCCSVQHQQTTDKTDLSFITESENMKKRKHSKKERYAVIIATNS